MRRYGVGTLGSQSAGIPWSHVKRKIEVLRGVCGLILITRLGRNGVRHKDPGEKVLLRSTKNKDEQQRIQQKEITKSNLKKPKSTNFPLLQMSPQISPANLFISG